MPDPKTIELLRGLVLSANDLKGLTDWPDALIEDYLTILDNLILLADTINVETDKNPDKQIYVAPTNRNFESCISDIKKLFFSEPVNKSYESAINDLKKLFFSKPVNIDFESRIRKLEEYIYGAGLITTPFTYYLKENVWDDLRFPASSVKGGGAFDTTPIAYKSGIVEAFSTGPNNESVQFIAQLPHGYKEDSNLIFHIHWVIPTSGAGLGAENVKWDFTYSWANLNDSFPVATSATVTVDVQAISADDHMLTDVVEISGIGKKISSILICSLTRDVGVANDYGDDAYFTEADFHYKINTIGSRSELEK